jgi:surfeit locus 1 family protein
VSRIRSFILASALGIAVLCGLGVWQLQRLASKEALLAEIAHRAEARPITLAAALAAHDNGENIDFVKVAARGSYLSSKTKFMIQTFDAGPGWQVVTPFRSSDGIVVLVDRGVVPEAMRTTVATPAGPVELLGLVRRHGAARSPFTPDNDDAANIWYWWDVPAMLALSDIPADLKVAPFVLQLLPVPGGAAFPRPQRPNGSLRNNHLQYAITWFALALVLGVVAVLYVRGQMKKTGA